MRSQRIFGCELRAIKATYRPTNFLFRFYHGNPLNYLSQIKLLVEANHFYRDLFDEETTTTSINNHNLQNVNRFKIKKLVSHGITLDFYCGSDIVVKDIEKIQHWSDADR